jgi:hypothetical protein
MPHLHHLVAADHSIKSVTLFRGTTGGAFGGAPKSAEVVRTFTIELLVRRLLSFRVSADVELRQVRTACTSVD